MFCLWASHFFLCLNITQLKARQLFHDSNAFLDFLLFLQVVTRTINHFLQKVFVMMSVSVYFLNFHIRVGNSGTRTPRDAFIDRKLKQILFVLVLILKY